MKNLKNFKQFDESFEMSIDEMPEVDDVVDNIDYDDGNKIAFIDYDGVKDIPVKVVDEENEEGSED